MNTPNNGYIELLPGDPRYRRLIRTAIKVNDKLALVALKGNTGKPIHFITQWFLYYLMQQGNPERDVVEIVSPPLRPGIAKILSQRADQAIELDSIPAETYDFLS
ncbi:hypothetical protein GCM10028808_60700 [Spirosoma migulaei]